MPPYENGQCEAACDVTPIPSDPKALLNSLEKAFEDVQERIGYLEGELASAQTVRDAIGAARAVFLPKPPPNPLKVHTDSIYR